MATEITNRMLCWKTNGDDKTAIARKLYLILPTEVFRERPDDQYLVFSRISSELQVPISSIQVVGSAKTGVSLVNGTTFSASTSDLDVAIVDNGLFLRMWGIAFERSNSFTDINSFKDLNAMNRFLYYIQRGIFAPHLMPRCDERAAWVKLFGDLTRRFKSLFKNVNAYVYASEGFFEAKQKETVEIFFAKKGIEK